MNLHNMTQKKLFEGYVSPSPVISRCYSSKAPVNTFVTSQLSGKSLLNMNKYLSNGGHTETKGRGLESLVSLKMPPAYRNSSSDSVCDPLIKIVGGFVGSKSQAGITNHRGREFSLWDVIVDKIFEVMEHPVTKQSQNVPKKGCGTPNEGAYQHTIQGFTMIGVDEMDCSLVQGRPLNGCDWCPGNGNSYNAPSKFTYDSPLKSNNVSGPPAWESSKLPVTDPISIPNSSTGTATPEKLDVAQCSGNNEVSPEESTCQVAEDPSFSKEFYLFSESEDDLPRVEIFSSSCDSESTDTPTPSRSCRTISECSVDSDDSFIVFESVDDDNGMQTQYSDEDYDSDEDPDEIDHYVLLSHNSDLAPHEPMLTRSEEANRKWNSFYKNAELPSGSERPQKKVSFAKGKDLTKIKRLIAWNFAHRAARVGPWEMYHRDCERFKDRISSLSSVISPVLANHHRKKIYSERFST